MVMSAAKFKSKSSIFMHRRKSPIIKDIDVLLREYERAPSENRKLKCLACIYLLCRNYQVSKPQGRRGGAVSSLLGDVRAELDSQRTRQSLNAKVGGRHYKGGQQRDVGTTMRTTATSMDGNYGIEGILPQRNFVQKMRLNLNAVLSNNEKYTGMTNLGIHNSLQFKISEILDKLHEMWLDPNEKGDFEYLNSTQRLDLMVVIRNGRFYNYKTNALISTHPLNWQSGGPEEPYAMDTDERLYCTQKKRFGTFNHSSFLSGHPVICAGTLCIQNGNLTAIDNNSGHYKPGTDNLVDCVAVLGSQGVDLDSFCVFDKARNFQKYNTARAFLTSHRGGGNLLFA